MSKQATQPLPPPHERPTREQLLQLMRERILVLDGAYGSAFQNYSLSEEAFRGESYADHDHPLQGNHDILNLTQPQIVAEVILAAALLFSASRWPDTGPETD